jgi:hypothetical protein
MDKSDRLITTIYLVLLALVAFLMIYSGGLEAWWD